MEMDLRKGKIDSGEKITVTKDKKVLIADGKFKQELLLISKSI